ncbi:tRNA (cytosine(72)-C(5))-methyltransferase NSUN6 isoform X3 [Salvelinus sp. IW2-2015]|uniref:tRNA (cytosine(72)-C(5))-methyltransferase NSUN6 isoform X3 n=1 Tax=Salvelinus sp. IW2-2015 TaxID=2691554 RepID=UPI000CDF951E|nr:putative methyltransferase NSUN6 isoform X3 [Salvelinus alpinus]
MPEEMSIFPRIALKPEVHDYLRNVFINKEVLAAVSQGEAEQRFQRLLSCLSHPPALTCVRASTHLASLEEIQHRLGEELKQQQKCDSQSEDIAVTILPHPHIPDVLLLPVIGPRPVVQLSSEVIVGAQCGSAVLRGAHVFAPGILATPKFMKTGDAVSVFSDLEGKCTRGNKDFKGKRVFVGNGVAEMDRADIFCSDEPVKGVGVRMVEPLYQSPSFDGVLPSLAFLQGEVVALDKIRGKVERIRQNAKALHLDCIKAHCFNSIKAVCTDQAQDTEGPPFPPQSFDRVLLDAPCSGLGQRPSMVCTWNLKEICSYQPLQRKLFHTAERLLKRGGVLVYSTCTVTLAENEEQVAWALNTFPCLTLQPQEPHIGAEGMLGAGLSLEQLRLLQRFSPELVWSAAEARGEDDSPTEQPESPTPLAHRANKDTIGFFIAKFLKS